MANIKFKEFVITPNGVIVMSLILLWAYPLFYMWVYPTLMKETVPGQFELDHDSRKIVTKHFASMSESDYDGTKNIYVEIRNPRYLVTFQDSSLTVSVENDTNKTAQGCLFLTGTMHQLSDNSDLGNVLLRLSSQESHQTPISPQETLPISLSPHQVITHNVALRITHPEADFIQLQMYFIPQVNGSCELASNTNEPPEFLSWESRVNTCTNLFNLQESPDYICIPVTSWGGFTQTVISNLLLPPWSNGILPFMVLAMVWCAERILESMQVPDDSRVIRSEQKGFLTFVRQHKWQVLFFLVFLPAVVFLSILPFLFCVVAHCFNLLGKLVSLAEGSKIRHDLSTISWRGILELLPIVLDLIILVCVLLYFSVVVDLLPTNLIWVKVFVFPILVFGVFLSLQYIARMWARLFPVRASAVDVPTDVSLFHKFNLQKDIHAIMEDIESGDYDEAYNQASMFSTRIKLPDLEGDFKGIPGLPAYHDKSKNELRLNKGATILDIFHKKIIHQIVTGQDARKDIDEGLIKSLPYEMQQEYWSLEKTNQVRIIRKEISDSQAQIPVSVTKDENDKTTEQTSQADEPTNA